MLRSGLCDYRDAYIVVKGIKNVRSNNVNRIKKKLTLDHVYHKSILH